MRDNPKPLLVYDRIDENKRQTRLLLAAFPLVFLPLISASSRGFFGALVHQIAYTLNRATALMNHTPVYEAPPVAVTMSASLVTVSLTLILAAVFVVSRYGSRVVVRIARAAPVDPHRDPELVHTVENLCIGAGLPMPGIYVMESMAPNAFATGNNPQRAALVVTRGLLTLLNRRELEGVIAHELSHIGNHDIRLTTTLAALVSMAVLPFTALSWAWKVAKGFGVVVLLAVFEGLFGWVHGEWCRSRPNSKCASLSQLNLDWFLAGARGAAPGDTVSYFLWWALRVLGAPFYVLFASPFVALLIRTAVSQQRELLADADAIRLTRDPEGLALALVKIGAVGSSGLSVAEGCVHLYFADPLDTSLLHTMFPSHPPLERRIDLLARMGSGIATSALQAARESVKRIRETGSAVVDTDVQRRDGADIVFDPTSPVDDRLAPDTEPTGWVHESWTPVYQEPNGWSKVIARIPHDAVVTQIGNDGNFIRIVTKDNVTGYVAAAAPLAGLKSVQR